MIKITYKPWGKEELLVLNDKYCIKKIYVDKENRLSLQYHEIKKETMILESGLCDLLLNGKSILMEIGKPYTIQPKDVHRLIAHTDTIILEVSTPEVQDIIRIEDDYDRSPESHGK